MKTFRLDADTTFDAEDLTDAFAILGRYFTALSHAHEDDAPYVPTLFNAGRINIAPLGE